MTTRENLTAHMNALFQQYGLITLLCEIEAICNDLQDQCEPHSRDNKRYYAIAEHLRAAMSEEGN